MSIAFGSIATGLPKDIVQQIVAAEKIPVKNMEVQKGKIQDKKGLASPQSTAESIAAIVARLESQRSELQTQRTALQAYLVINHPSIVLLDQQISAIQQQIRQEQGNAASGGL